MRLLFCLSALVIKFVGCADPIVTLSHGGQIQGKVATYKGVSLHLFLGVRFAEPPIGERRFKKPIPVKAWKGIVNATKIGSSCPQHDKGDEDCLFLDITVPNGVEEKAKKPVMLYIHGGSLTSGSGSSNIGAPLAELSDVIVVVINYRLGALGFLSDGPGTGNYGLWDQRAALVWTKENIASFGGDPDMITIFGTSSGGTSVAAQLLGQYNDKLFKRAIVQAGSLFNSWSWHLSERRRSDIVKKIKEKLKCNSTRVYDCFNGMGAYEIEKTIENDYLDMIWRPVPDGDFFSPNISDGDYDLAKRFDLMAGYNEQEGIVCIHSYFAPWSDSMGLSYKNGITMSWLKAFLPVLCEKLFTPYSPQLCANYLTRLYNLDSSSNNRQRFLDLTQLCGHSKNHGSELPEWMLVSADHSDEEIYVWGYPFVTPNLYRDYFGANDSWTNFKMDYVDKYSYAWENGKELSTTMMKMWTNFATTGNPNKPQQISKNTVLWPEFSLRERKYLAINSMGLKVIPTPNEERLQSLMDNIFVTRSIQVEADKACS